MTTEKTTPKQETKQETKEKKEPELKSVTSNDVGEQTKTNADLAAEQEGK